MGEGVRKQDQKEEASAGRRGSRLEEVLEGGREALLSLVVEFGLEAFGEMLQEDLEVLCGPRHARMADRKAYRHGQESSRLSMGGRRIRLEKPRLRGMGGREIVLPTWTKYRGHDPLEKRALEQIVCGVSSRKYDRSLDALEGVETSGTSKSSVSRRFVVHTKRRVEAFLSRPLGRLDLPVLMFDGIHMGRHVLILALGIDSDGHKHVLGVMEGTSESSAVCRQLLRQLIERGLKVERRRLIVTDGSKGLEKAIRTTFAGWYVLHRCRIHKTRNVGEHLPRHMRPWVKARMHEAWKASSPEQAERRLLALVAELDSDHPGAAGSLREGLEETLTVNRLALSGALLHTLSSTNPIENLNGSIKRFTRNVKRWRSGSMALRWAVTALIETEASFRRVRGYRDLPQLEIALTNLIKPELDITAKSA